MKLYTITEKGYLRKVTKLNFTESKTYLIDDYKTIYLWFGQKVSNNKKDLSVKKANNLNKKRKPSATIQIMNQKEEHGAFLAMMDFLKKGVKEDIPMERRAELELDIEDTMELIEAGLEPDFEAEVTLAAHDLTQQNKTYEELCRQLAETQLTIIEGKNKATEKEIKKKADDIYKSSSTYEELCWLIAELNLLIEKRKINEN